MEWDEYDDDKIYRKKECWKDDRMMRPTESNECNSLMTFLRELCETKWIDSESQRECARSATVTHLGIYEINRVRANP